jgi:hypothetical protein
MCTDSKTLKVENKFILERLKRLDIENIAVLNNYYKGRVKKVSLTNLLTSFFIMALSKKNTYSLWSQGLGKIIGMCVSKVCIWKRMNKGFLACLQSILEKLFKDELNNKVLAGYKTKSIFNSFSEVLLQDSTIISLPDVLHEHYKGSVSMGKQKSSVRIQAVYSLFKGFRFFQISSFTDNDQKASMDILGIVRPGYLIVRDLGYYVIKVFKEIAANGAFFLTRYHHGSNIYHLDTGEIFDLATELTVNTPGIVDTNVLLGKKEQLPCRLIAIKVPQHIAAERRRKVKKDRDKRLNHSKEYLHLLNWSIFITNVGTETWGWKDIIQAYRTRWYIEIVFKGWKSHFKITGLIPEAPKKNRQDKQYLNRYKDRVNSVIYSMLIFVVLFQVHFYFYWAFRINEKYDRQVSLLKTCLFVEQNIQQIFKESDINVFEQQILYYACYEKRKRRINQFEMIFHVMGEKCICTYG